MRMECLQVWGKHELYSDNTGTRVIIIKCVKYLTRITRTAIEESETWQHGPQCCGTCSPAACAARAKMKLGVSESDSRDWQCLSHLRPRYKY